MGTTSDRHPGLRKRLVLEARRISSQHRQLDDFFGMVVEGLRSGDPRAASDACAHFRDALESHFGIEESTHFPAIHGMDPDSDAELVRLTEEHEEMRLALGELQVLLDGGDLDASLQRLEGLGKLLAAHESQEESLFARTTGEPAGSV